MHTHVIFAENSAVFMAMAWSEVARLCKQNYKNYSNLEQTISYYKQFLKSKSTFKNNIYHTVVFSWGL